MTRLRTIVGVLSAALLGACGTISNEDLEFAAILPDEGLTLSLPPSQTANALVPPASTESFEAAVTTATELNQIALGVTWRLRQLVLHPAAVRRSGHREWGPLSVPGYAGALRLVMDVDSSVACDLAAHQVDAKARGFSWRLDASQSSAGPFRTLATGHARGAEFATSCGAITFDAEVDRSVGGSETDVDPRLVRVAWSRSPAESAVEAVVTEGLSVDAPLVEGKTYDYGETAAGGHFGFFRRYLPVNRPGVLRVLRASLDWGPQGSPWRTAYHVDDPTGTELSHGQSCGNEFGTPNFDRDDLRPGERVDDDDQESCNYAFPDGDEDDDDLRP